MDWISVKERLPEAESDCWSEPVIALSDAELIYKLSYFNSADPSDGCWQRTKSFADSASKVVTHWILISYQRLQGMKR